MRKHLLSGKHILLLLCLCMACTICISQAQPATPNTTVNPKVPANLTYKAINSTNGTYGYDVFMNNKLLIHQPSVPALPGNEGFKTKHDAAKVAVLVIGKIKKGEMPPSVTTDELRKLQVIH